MNNRLRLTVAMIVLLSMLALPALAETATWTRKLDMALLKPVYGMTYLRHEKGPSGNNGDLYLFSPLQPLVVDGPEELLQIKVHTPVVALLYVFLRLRHRLLSRSPRSEPVAVRTERVVPSLLQYLIDRLLHKSIHHRRDAEFPRASSWLRYFNPSHRLWSIGACKKLLLHARPVLPQVVGQVLDGHPVCSRRSCVGFHASQCFLQVLLLAHLLDQLVRVRLAFRAESRRRTFDPSLG